MGEEGTELLATRVELDRTPGGRARSVPRLYMGTFRDTRQPATYPTQGRVALGALSDERLEELEPWVLSLQGLTTSLFLVYRDRSA